MIRRHRVQGTAAPAVVPCTPTSPARSSGLRSRCRRGPSRLAVVALSVLGATTGAVLSVGVAGPAAADSIGDCSTTTGVIVAVDFAHWGGDIERGCDATLTTGYAALHAAGFTTAGDAQDGPGFICRIDSEPPPAEEACVTTPPADAYWSYWHADAGQNTWTYSTVGALSYTPPAGSVDAWTFGATDIDGTDGQPTFTPSQVRATNTSGTTSTTGPTTTGTAPSTSEPSTTVPPGASPPTTRAPSTAVTTGGSPASVRIPPPSTTGSRGGRSQPGTTSTTGAPTATSTTPSHRGTTAARRRGSTPKIVDALPAVVDRHAGGSPVPLIAGLGVVLAVAGAAGLVAWRRRRLG